MVNGYMIQSDNMSVKYFVGEPPTDPVSGDHCHDKYEITYHVSASGRYIVEGCEHNVSHGCLSLIYPMLFHKVILDTERDLEGYTVYFSRNALPEGVAALLDNLCADNNHGLFYSQTTLSDTLVSVFDRFEEAECLSNNERFLYMQALISELIILLSTTDRETVTVNEDELGARVTRYLNSNFRKNISLDKLARRFFVSKYYLCRAFKSYSGISIHAYINQKRIIYAKGLIELGMTASGAAERVGYGDYSAFYRAYVKIVGNSPTAN